MNLNLGKNFTVLFEGENKEGYITGFTENYVKVRHLGIHHWSIH